MFSVPLLLDQGQQTNKSHWRPRGRILPTSQAPALTQQLRAFLLKNTVRELLVVLQGQPPAQSLAEASPGSARSGRCCLVDSPPPRWFPPSARTTDLGFQVALAQGAGSHRRSPPTLLFDAISLSGTLCLDLLELHKPGDLGGRLSVLVNPLGPMRYDLLISMFLPIPVFSTSATK